MGPSSLDGHLLCFAGLWLRLLQLAQHSAQVVDVMPKIAQIIGMAFPRRPMASSEGQQIIGIATDVRGLLLEDGQMIRYVAYARRIGSGLVRVGPQGSRHRDHCRDDARR